ncbi:AAA family ATPase [Paraflavisolibacter sp. H34]|uniref:AAA family ATPase n=1 Tax=Huijunlia imazamoxiresistens TaxID=3127457 RepID=UPI0030176704
MWKLTEHTDWRSLVQKFSWVRDMKGVPQDPLYHAEGDVAVHTRMVLRALEELEGWRQLPPQDRQVLWAAALLHDVEKRSTTVREPDGSLTSKGHAKKGALTARILLYRDEPAPFFLREQVCALVRYHGLPLWALEKPDPVKAVLEASLQVNTKLLALLAEADVRGRVSADQEELLYKIGLFRLLCEEHGCWGQPRAFATPNARFWYFHKEDSYPGYVPFDEFRSRVVLLSGLPGAGKDTYAWHHYRDWPVISLDDIRRELKISPLDKNGTGKVVQLAKERARTYLRAGDNFVWNATNITRSKRQQLMDLFLTYKAFVTLVYVEVPCYRLYVQNSEREAVLPAAAIDRMIERLEVPQPQEAHEVVYHVEDFGFGLVSGETKSEVP